MLNRYKNIPLEAFIMKNKNSLAIPFIILLIIVGGIVAWYLLNSNTGGISSSNPFNTTSSSTSTSTPQKSAPMPKGLKGHVDPTSVTSDH